MIVNLIERDIFNPNHIINTSLMLVEPLVTTRDLIGQLVKYEISQNEKLQAFDVRDDMHLKNLVRLGKVGGIADPRQYQSPNLKDEIIKAEIAFTHKDYFIFVDDIEITHIDEKLKIMEESSIVVIANIRFR